MAYVLIVLFSIVVATVSVMFPVHTLVTLMGLYLAMLVFLQPPQGGPF